MIMQDVIKTPYYYVEFTRLRSRTKSMIGEAYGLTSYKNYLASLETFLFDNPKHF